LVVAEGLGANVAIDLVGRYPGEGWAKFFCGGEFGKISSVLQEIVI